MEYYSPPHKSQCINSNNYEDGISFQSTTGFESSLQHIKPNPSPGLVSQVSKATIHVTMLKEVVENTKDETCASPPMVFEAQIGDKFISLVPLSSTESQLTPIDLTHVVNSFGGSEVRVDKVVVDGGSFQHCCNYVCVVANGNAVCSEPLVCPSAPPYSSLIGEGKNYGLGEHADGLP